MGGPMLVLVQEAGILLLGDLSVRPAADDDHVLPHFSFPDPPVVP
jgi:hypothetical protein